MGTRAAAFTAKIHNLQHYNARIKHNLVPLPSGDDVANTLKYFSQTLLSVLKDVPSISLDMLRSPEKDAIRTSLFPSLDYKTLHNALVELVDAVPLVQHGAHALGYTILHTLACLVPFLEHELMDTLPYLVASTMTLFPCSLHKDIIDVLCNHLLPFTFREDPTENNDSYASMSTAAVLMMIFQYTDCSAYHCQVLECLMGLKKDIVKDLLCVIAHGTANARWHAAELLFQYLPSLNPALLDRKGIGWLLDSLCTLTCLVLFPTFSPSSVSPSLMPQGSGHTGWKAQLCQRENCTSITGNEAVKMCFEHSVAIASGEHPPPLYMCEACAEEVEKEHGSENLVDVLLPMKEISVKCEDPDCKGGDKSAVATCFSMECAKRNGHRPIRYCAQCVVTYHNETQGENHMIHTTIPSPWSMDLETQSYMVEAVISLLREAEPLNERHVQESMNGQDDREDSRETTVVEERQLLSRYGIWLLVGLCAPDENTPDESLGRLLSMLFQWFVYTACLPDDKAGNALEKLKKEYIQGWLLEVKKNRFEVYVSCLLPHPVDYAKVGGHWESWPCYPVQIREGFKRLLCLIPYDIITEDVWEYIMPYWMDSLRHEAIEAEFPELKLLLSRVFDPCLRFLDFDTKEVYKFLTVRFDCPSSPVQEQALYWLQILSMLEIPVPLEMLYDMFKNGVTNLASRDGKNATGPNSLLIPHPSQEQKGPNGPTTSRSQKFNMNLVNVPEEENPLLVVEYESEAEIDLPCYILMLDILIKQLELQDIPLHKGLEQKDAQTILLLIRDQIEAPWEGTHTCNESNEGSQCIFCEMCAIFFQLTLSLIEYFSPAMELTMADVPGDTPVAEVKLNPNLDIDSVEKNEQDIKIEYEMPSFVPHKDEITSVPIVADALVSDNGERSLLGHLSPVQTATVQECSEMDTVSIIPTEKVVTAVATEVTLTEDDVAGAKCTVASPLLIDENEQSAPPPTEDLFWPTTEGKYKFTIEELPPQLQLFYVLLKDLVMFEDADVLYHILSCLKVMCLHSEVLNKAAHSHRGFLIWCQESSLVVNLWKLLQMEFSHIAQLATSLLLHAVTLPSGYDMFWKIIEQDFHSKEWRTRFSAVERVTVIAHFVDPSTVKNSPLLQSALSCAFCYLFHALDDDHPTVSQRTLLNLESIKAPSVKLLVWCCEKQFDWNITDRPMILETIIQLHNFCFQKRFLTWDFFLGRFDSLFLEDQIILEKLGEISYIRDLKNTNVNSEMFQKKLKRAQDALAYNTKFKSLAASFGDKIPFKRSTTAPSSMSFRPDKTEKEKFYERPASAPVLKRKTSRLIGSTVGAPLQHFPNSFFTDGHLKETLQEDTHFLNILYRSMDIEDNDKETLHLLIFLLMQFLSRPDPLHRFDENPPRSLVPVMRHLCILLGYSQSQGEGRFLLPPHKIRNSAIFSTFLLCMPKILDNNFKTGNHLLIIFLSVLVCCPASHKYPSEHFPPNYSLWLLSSYCRHSWLQSTLVIMYKYHYENFPFNRYIKWLILIILNTLKSQRHRCKLVHEQLPSPLPSRSRDFSTPSADLEHGMEKDKDAFYDTSSLHEEGTKSSKVKAKFSSDKVEETAAEQAQKQISKDKSHQWKSWRSSERSCSSDGEDAEPELEAIPESPKSESSETEQLPTDLSCYPQTVEQACAKLVSDSAKENEVVSDPWPKVTETNLVSNSENLNMNVTEFKDQNVVDMPHSSVSSDAENVGIIEKSSYEVMEKNIVPETKPEIKDIPEKKLIESKDKTQSPILKKLASQCSFSETDPLLHYHPVVNVPSTSDPSPSSKPEIQLVVTKKDIGVPDYNKLASVSLKRSESRDISRMKSLPFEGNKHQSVCRSKTDSNILDLPQNDDSKMSHSRYPHSKAFHSKKNIPKSSRKAEMLSSENLTVPIFRPPLERLLPIGMPDRDKPKRSDTLTHTEPEPYHQPLRTDHNLSRDTFSSRDLCEDKGVQTGNVDIMFDIPAPERLLPVGPLPSKKDSYPSYSRSESELKKQDSVKTHIEPKLMSPDPKGATSSKVSEIPKTVEQKSVDKEDKQDTEVKDVPASKSEIIASEPKAVEKTESEDKKCLEHLNSFPFGSMGIECIANTIFDFTSDIAPTLPGIFEVCKTAMDIKKEDTIEDKKSKEPDHTDHHRDHRNSSCSVDGLQNEKIELSTFSDNIQKGLEKAFEEDSKCRLPYRQRKQRKSGFIALEAQRSFDYQTAGGRRMRKVEMGNIPASLASKRSSTSQSPFMRCGDDMVIERCTECGAMVEEYNDEEIGLCIVILATFVHREPAMAAPLLPKMLRIVARIASSPNYPWQNESNVHLPGGSVSVARQFLRCTLHQLAPNGVFVQIFQSHTIEPEFYKTMASALADFTEVNQVTPLLLLFENLNDRKHLHHEVIFHILENVATYLDCLPLESTLPPWSTFLQQLDLFLRKLLLTLTPGPIQLNCVLQIILCALKLPVIKEAKSILDPFSKILSHAIQHSSLDYSQLSDLCTVCNKNARDRDKQLLTRTAVFELIQALKFKTSIPDANLLTLVQFILADCGGRLAPNVILDGIPYTFDSQSVYKTLAGECMQQYLNDALEFVSDVHTLTKVKNMLYGNYTHLNEETLGGHLKAGISQYLAIEFSKNNGRDNRAISRYLPWLYHPPTALQQGPKEFIDCVSHIRLLSWLLLGALIHSALMQTPSTCQPIPLEANCHIAEHIQVILAGFSEQSKVSVLHMSSLFHAFILCQLWTMYCEHMVALNPPGSEQNQACGLTLTDFWAKVTPGILQLICHSKVEEYPQLAEMVSLHFLSLMEALQECNSTVLARLLPMWTPVLYSFQGHLSGNLYMRLYACVSCRPPSRTRGETASISTTFLRWLQRLQFKMGQIEMQSSTATQFYSL